MLRNLFLWASRSRRLAEWLPRLPAVRRAVGRFIPGETVGDALDAAEALEARGMASVFTHLGENVETAAEADAEVEHYLEVLDRIERRGLDAELSVKLTHLGLDQGREGARARVATLARRAAEVGSYVWIDMESTAYTDATLRVFEQVRRERPGVGVCLQAYLHRTPDDLERLLASGASVRLVKGAYDEPPERALREKDAVDEAFLRLADRMLAAARERGTRQAFGTHDLRLLRAITGAARETGVPDELCEIQMLYGIRNRDLERLAEKGHACRVLVSYGEAWFPWFMRRLAERPANALFVLRSVLRR